MRDEGKIITEQRIFTEEKLRSPSRFSQQQKPTSNGWFWQVSLGFLAVCILVWCWTKVINPQTFPIRAVQIKGNYPHVDRDLLRKTILPSVAKSFFLIDTMGLQDRLSQLPWINKAKVERIWPDSVVITLIEQQPLARFGENQLLNSQGELFTVAKATVPPNLPLFAGEVGQQKLMLQLYQQLLPLLIPLKLAVAVLSTDPRESWQLQLNNGLVLDVGRVDPLPRLQRFFAVYPNYIAPKLAMIQSVDLRYAHGMAVSFKGAEHGDSSWQKNRIEI